MPEEINRALSHACDLLLASTEFALANLQVDGLSERSHLISDLMADLPLDRREGLDPRVIHDALGLEGEYVVAAVHRASNTDVQEQLSRLVEALARLALPLVLVAHPRFVAAAQRWEMMLASGAIRVLEPLDYRSISSLLVDSRGLITDSGGLHKGKHLCWRLRALLCGLGRKAETLAGGRNMLESLKEYLQELVTQVVPPPTGQPYGADRASQRIIDPMLASV